MSRVRDQVAREKARRDARLWAAGAGGRSGLPAPATAVRQRGSSGMGSAASATVNIPAASSAEPGQGTPATVTAYAEGLSVPSGDGVDAVFDATIEDDARTNLLALSDDDDGVVLTFAGTYLVDIWRAWTLTPSFRGGGAMQVLLDGEVVWPLSPESTTAAPNASYDLPEFRSAVVVRATAGQVLSVRPTQDSGQAQTCDLQVSVSLLEPQGAAGAPSSIDPVFPALLLVGNAIIDQDGWSKIRAAPASAGFASAFPSADGFRAVSTPISSSGVATYSVWDAVADTVETGWPSLGDYSGETIRMSVAVSPDGSKVAFGISRSSSTQDLVVVDVATKTVEAGWPTGVSETMSSGGRPGVAWSPDGERLVWCPNELRVYDVATKTQETGWTSGTGNIEVAAFSPSGERLAIWGGNGASLAIIDVETKLVEGGWPSKSKGPLNGFYSALGWSPDSRYLAVVDDRNLGNSSNIVIDAETKTDVTSTFGVDPPGSNHNAIGVAWSRDGQFLAMGWSVDLSDSVRLQVFDVSGVSEVFRGTVSDVGTLRAVLFPGNHSSMFSA